MTHDTETEMKDKSPQNSLDSVDYRIHV